MYEDKLIETLNKSKSMSSILRALMQLDPPFEYYVGARSVTNTIWNEISGYPMEYGISDIDIIYYDKYNIDAHNEIKLKKELERILGDFSFKLDVKNQARVHFWYESKFGFPIKPYMSIETAIDSWPTTVAAIGVRLEHNGLYSIYSPYGLNDLFSMVVRPNKLLVTQEIYESKSTKWKKVAIIRDYTLVIHRGGASMNFYIASSFQNIQQVRELAKLLKQKGWNHTYDWTENQKAESYECLAEIGKKEMKAVSESELLIVILPAGKGSHIEMGLALALGKSIYLFSTYKSSYNFDQTSTFYHVDGVNRYVGDLSSFAQSILAENVKSSSI